jgi:hypothetical protein
MLVSGSGWQRGMQGRRGLRAHGHAAGRNGAPPFVRLAADVDHVDAALVVDVAQTLISRHFRQAV